MVEKVKEICEKAIEGKISAESFYDRLCEIADDDSTDGDIAAVIEDGLMEIEMTGAAGSKSGKRVIREIAENIIEGLDR